MNIQGKIYRIFPTEQVTETLRKREFVLEYATNPQYPQYVKFELINTSCELLDNFNEGQFVGVDFDISGREWKSPAGEIKYFNSLKAWRIGPASAEAPTTQAPRAASQPATQASPAHDALPASADDGADDLPF